MTIARLNLELSSVVSLQRPEQTGIGVLTTRRARDTEHRTSRKEKTMVSKSRDLISRLIRDVEKTTRQLNVHVRKRAKGAPKELEAAARKLRQGAAQVARQVEKYAHGIRLELEGRGSTRRKPAGKTTRS